MAVILDESQLDYVRLRRRKPANRPKYYSAAVQQQVTIGEDFEAFLILQGRQRNQETVQWLELALELTIRDGDRDSLAALAYKNDAADARQVEQELQPLVNLFSRFKQSYSLTGFETVAECGQLLADMQRPMSEIITVINKARHRQVFAQIGTDAVRDKGVTNEHQKQINSWFSPLTSY